MAIQEFPRGSPTDTHTKYLTPHTQINKIKTKGWKRENKEKRERDEIRKNIPVTIKWKVVFFFKYLYLLNMWVQQPSHKLLRRRHAEGYRMLLLGNLLSPLNSLLGRERTRWERLSLSQFLLDWTGSRHSSCSWRQTEQVAEKAGCSVQNSGCLPGPQRPWLTPQPGRILEISDGCAGLFKPLHTARSPRLRSSAHISSSRQMTVCISSEMCPQATTIPS